MNQDIERILLTEHEIGSKIKLLGEEITRDYKDKKLVLISILKGSVVFLSDLMRCIELPCALDFMAVSSYGAGTASSGAVRILKDLDMPVEGKDILIIEDILDSGMTLGYIMNLIVANKPASVRLCALLDKPSRRRAPITANYTGFTVPDEFLVGYGMDYGERYRNLPYIGVLSRNVYGK